MVELSQWTPARVELGRFGCALPTREVLSFRMAHAQARDAVQVPVDWRHLREQVANHDLKTHQLHSQAFNRETYVARPDLGRILSKESRALLEHAREATTAPDIALVICDGLSGKAVESWAAPVVEGVSAFCQKENLWLSPVCFVQNGRVAIGDEIGEILGARLVILLVGERPGLSSADSLGAYLTLNPKVGTTDEARNCISNIRATGLEPSLAVSKISWLAKAAIQRGLTGTKLKEESGVSLGSLRMTD